jgi:hypothetical protein
VRPTRCAWPRRATSEPDAVAAVLLSPARRGDRLTADALGRAFAVTALRPVVAAPARPSRRAAVARRHGPREADVLTPAFPAWTSWCGGRRRPAGASRIYVPRVELDPPRKPASGRSRCEARWRGRSDAAALAFGFERRGTPEPVGHVGLAAFGTSVLSDRLAEAAALLESCSRRRASRGGWSAARPRSPRRSRWRTTCSLSVPARVRGGLGEEGTACRSAACRTRSPRSRRRTRARGTGARSGRPRDIAVGELDPERASAAGRGVGGGAARGAARPRSVAGGRDGEAPSRVVARDKAQAAIAMAFPGVSRRHPTARRPRCGRPSRAGSAVACSRR